MTAELAKDLVKLGDQKTVYVYDKPSPELLETFPNPMSLIGELSVGYINEAVIEIRAPEFTSLCPKTGQPDFATIVIKYIPDKLCVESKALKLYLGSFRQHGSFHEACVAQIMNDLIALMHPRWIEVEGQFTPRGGIPFWPKMSCSWTF